jgi:hypothetical protein
MDNAPSRRLRLRLFPEDDKALDDTLKLTNHASKSNVIRGALTFFDQVWSNKRAGFRVLYFRDGRPDRVEVLDAAVSRPRGGKKKDGKAPKRSRTEKSIEIRLSHVDEERIDRLLAMEAADTFSEVVRRAIRLYAAVVARCKDGWEVAALSPSGDMLAVTVPGLGSEGQVSAAVVLHPEEMHAGGRAPVAAGALSEMLPRSLVDSVRALAAREGCTTDLLLVDMVRTETFARLRRLDEGASILEMPVLEPPELSSVEVMPEPEPEPVSTKEEAPASAATDTRVIDEVSRTLDQMADNIEKVMQLVGETGRSKGPQGELTDLFLSTSGEVVGLGELSPTERLFQRAQELNERLTALVALTRRERKPRAPKSTRASTEENPESAPSS